MRHSILCLLVLISLGLAARQADAAVYTVTSTNDNGPFTLRQALIDANANPGADEIRFNIPGTAPFLIQPLTALPTITETVTLDGTTQPGYAGTPLIEVDGYHGSIDTGLTIGAGGCILRGIWIYGFYANGLYIQGSQNTIERCYLTVFRNGLTTVSSCKMITFFSSSQNHIGLPGAGNLISGNSTEIDFVQSSNNTVQGNLIGTDATGNARYSPTMGGGIELQMASSRNLIGGSAPGAGNVIANCGTAIYIGNNGCTSTTVQGNYIGTNVTGTAAIANTNGITILGDYTKIGGCNPGEGNLISGNTETAVYFQQSDYSVIQGNFIGTNAAGTAAIPNRYGIATWGLTSYFVRHLRIGGTAPGAGNLISGNLDLAIQLLGTEVYDAIIQGNKVGTDITGTQIVANGDQGVLVDNGTHDDLIGGDAPGAANIFAHSQTTAIQLCIEAGGYGGGWPQRIRISANSIYDDKNYAIDIQRDDTDKKRSLNDHLDADDGPNGEQNYPVINPTVNVVDTTATITGTLDSVPNKTYRIELFSSPQMGNQPEAWHYLGHVDAATDALGAASFSFQTPSEHLDRVLTATATDPDGNTSELSVPVQMPVDAVRPKAWMNYR